MRSIRRAVGAAYGGLAGLLLSAGAARAHDLPTELSVDHGAGAEKCANRAELEQRVQAISDRTATSGSGAKLSIDVRFERSGDGAFIAQVTASGTKAGQRVLRDSGPTCDALSEAVTVTIALLLDNARADAERNRTDTQAATPPQPPASQPSVTIEASAPAPRSESQSWKPRLALEAAGGYGLGGTRSLLGVARIGARRGHWLLDLAGAGSWPRSSTFQSGAIETSLLFGSLRACYLLGHSSLIGPCAQAALGRLRGEGSSFAQAQAASLPWTAGGLGLAGDLPLGPRVFVSWEGTLWVPTRRQTFSVENAGIAWESSPLSGLVGAGLGVELF